MIADSEAVMIAALAPLGVMVATQVPVPLPPDFVRVVAGGGPAVADEVVDVAWLALEVWSQTAPRAAELAGRVVERVNHLQGRYGGAWVSSATATRPRWFPDESSPRYVLDATLTIHAH